MPGPVKIHVRGGYFRGGNSIDDVLELAKLGPAWFEMDFRLSNQGVLLSGHDETTYAKLGGPLMSEIVNPLEVRNKKGGRCATLKAALEHMAPRSRMFIDLKNTWKTSKAEVAVETAIRDIETSKRTDEAVIMVYTRHAPLCTLRRTRIPFCLKQISRKYSEEENLEFVALASEVGAKYICCPVPPSYSRFCSHLPGSRRHSGCRAHRGETQQGTRDLPASRKRRSALHMQPENGPVERRLFQASGKTSRTRPRHT